MLTYDKRGVGKSEGIFQGGDNEAAFVIRHGGYYYLFFNRGICCNGSSSTYYIQVGRSTSPNSGFVDKSGRALTCGGGTSFDSTSGRFVGPGCLGYFSESVTEYITYHY